MRKISVPFSIATFGRAATTRGGKLYYSERTSTNLLDRWESGIARFINKALSGRYQRFLDTSHWPLLRASNWQYSGYVATDVHATSRYYSTPATDARVRGVGRGLNIPVYRTHATRSATILFRTDIASGSRLTFEHIGSQGNVIKTTTSTVRGGFVALDNFDVQNVWFMMIRQANRNVVAWLVFDVDTGDVATPRARESFILGGRFPGDVVAGVSPRPYVETPGDLVYPAESLIELRFNAASYPAVVLARNPVANRRGNGFVGIPASAVSEFLVVAGDVNTSAGFQLQTGGRQVTMQPTLDSQDPATIAIRVGGTIFLIHFGSTYTRAFGKPPKPVVRDPRPVNPVPMDDEDDDDGTVPSTDDDVPDTGDTGSGGTGTGATGGQRGGGTLGPVTPRIFTKTLQINGFSTGVGYQDRVLLNATESANEDGVTLRVRGVGLASGWSVRRGTFRGEIVHFVRVPDSAQNGAFRFDVVTTGFGAGALSTTYNVSAYINRHIVEPPRPARPNPTLRWGSYNDNQRHDVKLADRARFRVPIPRAIGSQDGTIRVTGFVTGDIIYGSENNEIRVPNIGSFPVDISSLGSGVHNFDLALKAESDTLEEVALISVRVNIEQPDVVDPGSTNGGGRGRVRPEVLAWAGGYLDGSTHRISITRQELPVQLPGCGVADATYNIVNSVDPTMSLSNDRRISTQRPQLYATGRQFVYRATKDGQSITLVILLQVAAPAAEPLVFAGYEGYTANSEVEFIQDNDDPVEMLRPTGGVGPYTLRLRGVNPARTMQYRPNTNDIFFPSGLEPGQSFSAVVVATDSEGTEAAIGIRITRRQADDDGDDTTVVREEPTVLSFNGGIKAGSTLVMNLRNTNTFRLPSVSNPDATLTLTPDTIRFVWDKTTGLVTVNPEEVTGVPHRDMLLSAQDETAQINVIIRLEAGRDFAFRGGHGNSATYDITGGNDIASINLPLTNYYLGEVSYDITVDKPNSANFTLERGSTVNKLVFGELSEDVVVTYKASNQTSTATIIYRIQANSVIVPSLPPEGGVLRLGIDKQLNFAGVNRERVDRSGLQVALIWRDPCVEAVEEIRYILGSNDTRINLPTVSGGTANIRYELVPLGATPPALVSASGLRGILSGGRGVYRYRLVVRAGRNFIAKNILVRIDPGVRAASADYLADCNEGAQPITPVVTTRDSGAIVLHFAGVLQEGGRLARLPGTVIGSYSGLVPGAFYGVNDSGHLARIPIVNGKAQGVYFLRAISSTQLVILPNLRGSIRS